MPLLPTVIRSVRRIALTACASMLFAPMLAAQTPTGSVAGTVIDSDGKPIPDVEIIVVETKTSIRSDSVGKFLLASLEAGDRALRVRRLAYAPVAVTVHVEPKDTIDVTITLTVVAQTLNAVLVHEDVAHVRIMRQFEERRKRGFGHFITRREIEDRHPLLLSDMMRRIPGAMLRPAAGGRSVLRFSRALIGGTRDCPPQYWVDGVMVSGFNIDDIMPSDIEGVELYSGVSVIPPEFNNPRSTVACGLVVIWTRVP